MSDSITTNPVLNIAVQQMCKNPEISDLIHLLLKNQQETRDNVHSIQKSIAGLREQVQDSRAEHAEDNAEVKRLLLHELRHKVWLPKEAA